MCTLVSQASSLLEMSMTLANQTTLSTYQLSNTNERIQFKIECSRRTENCFSQLTRTNQHTMTSSQQAMQPSRKKIPQSLLNFLAISWLSTARFGPKKMCKQRH